MEKFSLNKHWDMFIQDKVVINCQTEELAEEFLEYCESKGMTWASGEKLSKFTEFFYDKKDTCYCCWNWYNASKIVHASTSYYSRQGYKVVEFCGFNSEFKFNNKENIEVIYSNNRTIVIIHNGKKYYKGVSKCSPEDTYNKEYGFILAYQRAREQELLRL